MANAYLQGIQSAFDQQAQVRNDVHVVAINWFVNRCPLVTRLPRAAVGSTAFTMLNRSFRTRFAKLSAAVGAADGQISLEDASSLMNGDVLELPSGERVAAMVSVTGRPSETSGAHSASWACAVVNSMRSKSGLALSASWRRRR